MINGTNEYQMFIYFSSLFLIVAYIASLELWVYLWIVTQALLGYGIERTHR